LDYLDDENLENDANIPYECANATADRRVAGGTISDSVEDFPPLPGSAEPWESALMRRLPKSFHSQEECAVPDWAVPDVPPRLPRFSDNSGIFVSVDYAEANINSTEVEIDIAMALDSGAVDHVIAQDHLPSSAEIGEVTGSRIGKTFVAANGEPMRTFGETFLECQGEDGISVASFAVTEVSRPLQSVSRICDQDFEILFTKHEAKIRDPKTGKWVATYPRRGGLYVRNVRARAGKKPDGTSTRAKPAMPFGRPSKR